MESILANQPSSDAPHPMLPAPVWRILLIGGLAFGAGIGVARLARQAPTETYPGTLTARIVPVAADRTGVISQWLVTEGDPVEIGQALVSMADPSIDERREQLEADIQRLQAELEQALARAELELDWRMKEINETIFTARLQSADFLEQKHAHEMEMVALTDLLASDSTAFWTQPDSAFDTVILNKSQTPESRFNAALRLESATNSSEVCTAQVELCDEQIEWLEELKEMLPDRVKTSVGVDLAKRNLEEAQTERAALEEVQSRVVTVSPAIGRAGVQIKRAGDYAAVGEPLVEILDDSRRFIVAEVPSEQVGQFTIGKELKVWFPGAQKCTGRVTHIAPQAVVRNDGKTTGAFVNVNIEQSGRVWPDVPIGARVEISL